MVLPTLLTLTFLFSEGYARAHAGSRHGWHIARAESSLASDPATSSNLLATATATTPLSSSSLSASASVTASSSAIPSTSVVPGSGLPKEKYAVVHHMVGNTYTYREVDWMTDILQIEEAGFDAIALNTGPDCWQKASADLAYKAAAKLNTKVKFFWSFDMNTFPQAGDEDASKVASYINEYIDNPYTFTYAGKPVVSTFSGDQWNSAFGSSMCGGWDSVKAKLTEEIYFIPGFFLDVATYDDVSPCIDGLFQWNSAWPTSGGPQTTDRDISWMDMLLPDNKTYMAGVSPTFFTHYGEDSLNKNFVYEGGNMYADRWDQVANINAPLVQVITWNDFGESHYIGPRPSTVQLQPGGTTWVNSANHLPWAKITKPFIQQYKAGAPEQLASDLIVWQYRTHPANAVATADTVGLPSNTANLTDSVYITSYLSAPAEIRVTVGSLSGSFNAPAGLAKFEQPFEAGSVTVGMWRDGENVGGTLAGEVDIVEDPITYNFNPIVEAFFHDPNWEAC